MRHKNLTNHHIIPKSCGGTYYGANIERKTETQHRAHHTLFVNDAPHEQVGRIVDLTGRAFKKVFADDLLSVINDYNIEDIYHPKCFDMAKMVEHILLNSKK